MEPSLQRTNWEDITSVHEWWLAMASRQGVSRKGLKSLTLCLDVGIGGWNSELELASTNASVWMSNELGNGITSKYRAAFDWLARASSRFRPLPPRYREAFTQRLPPPSVSRGIRPTTPLLVRLVEKKEPPSSSSSQAAGEACVQDPAAGEARARLAGRTTGGGPLHLHGRARVGRASPPPLPFPARHPSKIHGTAAGGGVPRAAGGRWRRPEQGWRRRGPPPSSSSVDHLLLPP